MIAPAPTVAPCPATGALTRIGWISIMSYCLEVTNGESQASTVQHFSVVRIICIGRNYASHAIEMGSDPAEDPPFFFFKPVTALNTTSHFTIPSYSQNVHHELELIAALGSGGRHLSLEQAKACIAGFAIGLDMTCRDVQSEAKKEGRPWDTAKGFDGSAPCTRLLAATYNELDRFGEMTLKRNGHVVQKGHWRNMVWSLPELIRHISQFVQLVAGDFIMTGTPAGVGPVAPGDRLEASMMGFPHSLALSVAREPKGQ